MELRKGLPILPSGSSSAIGTDNIPLIQGAVVDGTIVRVTLHTAGSGYNIGDGITINGGTGGNINVDAIDESGGITRFTIDNGGSGYSPTTGVGVDTGNSKFNIIEVGTGVDIGSANGVSTVKDAYKNKL